ncbi:MAG TPA: amidohydrolase family protein [Polyangiaceae bacterium]|nr:amidohydrolase family protein [Polyangiaceae bacterium]
MGIGSSLLVGACSSDATDTSRHGAGSSPEGGAGGDGAGGSGATADAGCVPPMLAESCSDALPADADFIVDTHTEWMDPTGLTKFPAYQQAFGPLFAVATEDAYIQNLFCDSDTTVACLSGWAGVYCTETRKIGCGMPLGNDVIVRSRDEINGLAGNTQRVLNHFLVMPQDPSGLDFQLALMEEYQRCHGVAGWQLIPGFKPGYRLDGSDGLAKRVIEKGLELGVKVFVIHKGQPIGNFFDPLPNSPDDVGPVAAQYPEATFVIDGASYCSDCGLSDAGSAVPEGPYLPDEPAPIGVNALIRTVEEHSLYGKNVCAGLGKAFYKVMADPAQTAHLLGKLLKYLGPDNVLWGTGAVTHPAQQQIEAFRSFAIPQSTRDQYGYPELTADLKAKVFGLNAARVYGLDPGTVRCRVSRCT